MRKCSVLFVCLGNICRSPVAAGVFKNLVKERGLEEHFVIDSCGTGAWHEGQGAHPETVRIARKRGVILTDHSARQVRKEDFSEFNIIVAMDRSNLRDLERFSESAAVRLFCLREFDPADTEPDVPDPFSGGRDGFELVHDIISRSCENLLNELVSELKK